MLARGRRPAPGAGRLRTAKVSIIGAGSVEFTRNVVTDLCSFTELHGTLELALHDIDADRLRTPSAPARQLVERSGAGYGGECPRRPERRRSTAPTTSSTRSRSADTPRPVTDFDVPARYGVRQTIADTIGIGGIMRGLRTIPVCSTSATTSPTGAPDAYLLNYRTRWRWCPGDLRRSRRSQRVVGVCHCVRDTHPFLAELVGVPRAEVEFSTAGFNHQCVRATLRAQGDDLYPRLREIVEADPELGGACASRSSAVRLLPDRVQRALERVRPWFMRHDDQVEQFRCESTSTSAAATKHGGVRGHPNGAGRRRDARAEPTTELASRDHPRASRPASRRELYGNVRNEGADRGPARRRLRRGARDWSPTGLQPQRSARCRRSAWR